MLDSADLKSYKWTKCRTLVCFKGQPYKLSEGRGVSFKVIWESYYVYPTVLGSREKLWTSRVRQQMNPPLLDFPNVASFFK